MDKHYVDERVAELASRIYGLERTVDNLEKTVSMLSTVINTKVNKEDVQEMVKQSVVIKKINDSKSVGMDCKVGISLDGKVSLESIVEQITDAIKMSANDIKGVITNETN
ncbi:hypothetical protein J7E43_16125 [Bacillus sp. ISL-8]|nr:hypothetical protein [Bacillus sp. ISL-8]